jgi:hypothetical protein
MTTKYDINCLSQLPPQIENIILDYKFSIENEECREYMRTNVLKDLVRLMSYIEDQNYRGNVFSSVTSAIAGFNSMILMRRVAYIESTFDSGPIEEVETTLNYILSFDVMDTIPIYKFL